MLISAKCQYALRAVFAVAVRGQDAVMTIGEIAAAQNIPSRYLEGILNQLRKAGLLEALRGRSGGYRLSRDPARITMGDVVRIVDGPLRMVACSDERPSADCTLIDGCVFQPVWQTVERAINAELDATTFAALVERAGEVGARTAPAYVI